jgi:hypothetical protein
LGWLGILVFAGGAGLAFASGETWPSLGLLVFALLSAYLPVAAHERYAVDADALHKVTPIGRHYRMAWSDVRYVEFGTAGTFVFHGANKRFVLPPAALWSGANKRAVYMLAWPCSVEAEA